MHKSLRNRLSTLTLIATGFLPLGCHNPQDSQNQYYSPNQTTTSQSTLPHSTIPQSTLPQPIPDTNPLQSQTQAPQKITPQQYRELKAEYETLEQAYQKQQERVLTLKESLLDSRERALVLGERILQESDNVLFLKRELSETDEELKQAKADYESLKQTHITLETYQKVQRESLEFKGKFHAKELSFENLRIEKLKLEARLKRTEADLITPLNK
jgi:hypothetical protein